MNNPKINDNCSQLHSTNLHFHSNAPTSNQISTVCFTICVYHPHLNWLWSSASYSHVNLRRSDFYCLVHDFGGGYLLLFVHASVHCPKERDQNERGDSRHHTHEQPRIWKWDKYRVSDLLQWAIILPKMVPAKILPVRSHTYKYVFSSAVKVREKSAKQLKRTWVQKHFSDEKDQIS